MDLQTKEELLDMYKIVDIQYEVGTTKGFHTPQV